MKTCFKCGSKKPNKEFYKHPAMADGRLGKCKQCTRLDVHQRYFATRCARQEYERKRFQDPSRRAYVYAKAKEHRAKNPDKYRARTAVSNAIRDGRLTRKPCEVCGAKAQAHHNDYSKPLEIRWFCRAHHPF